MNAPPGGVGHLSGGCQTMRLVEQDGSVLHEIADDGTRGRPEVQRGELRWILLDSLPAEAVRWGHKVSGTRALGGGRHEVAFADGSTVVTSLLVGADGAWSRVRPLLSDATPEYVGTSFVETYLFDADTRHTGSAKVGGGGSMIAPSPGKEIFAHRENGDTLHAYVALSSPQDWFAAIDFTDASAAATRITREFGGWAPELTALITDAGIPPVLRPHYALPAGHRWSRVPGVILLGDAAHLAAPNGEGASLAMLDGAELGKTLAAYADGTEAALTEYEQAVCARSTEPVAFEGTETQRIDSESNTPQAMLKMITEQSH
ncbi:FAD-dependent monooxygenase [Streptomyces sp. NPDC047049]|uniref:FAD-dependent oxidoreductase n=1 Tax=Streptomyces sp. NPDC047049 TaxID=3156688 RepID=UPI0034054EA2